MAQTNKSMNDYITQSFGEESETAPTDKNGFIIGGVYNATPPTIADGEFSRAQVDASGNLMVNVAAGEVVAVSAGTITAGTINTLKVGTINTGTIDLMKAGTITALANGTIGAGTVNTLGTVSNVLAGSITVVAGTIGAFTADIPGGTIDAVSAVTNGSIVVTVGTIAAGTVNVVGKYTTYTGTVVLENTKSAGTLASTIAGKIHGLTQTSGDMDGTGTVTTRLIDGAGGTIAALAAQDESLVTYYGTEVPITTNMSWVVTCNAAQTANVNNILTIHYEQ